MEHKNRNIINCKRHKILFTNIFMVELKEDMILIRALQERPKNW